MLGVRLLSQRLVRAVSEVVCAWCRSIELTARFKSETCLLHARQAEHAGTLRPIAGGAGETGIGVNSTGVYVARDEHDLLAYFIAEAGLHMYIAFLLQKHVRTNVCSNARWSAFIDNDRH